MKPYMIRYNQCLVKKIAVFLASAGCLYISMVLFYHAGIFVDEHNANLAMVLGGDVWLYVDWLRLPLLLALCLLTFIGMVSHKQAVNTKTRVSKIKSIAAIAGLMTVATIILFYYENAFVRQNNLSLLQLYGGTVWYWMNWLRVILLPLICADAVMRMRCMQQK